MNTLVIGDLHEPFTFLGYFDFCKSIREKYKCEKIVLIGDVVDNHAISYHEKDPDGFGGGREGNEAEKRLQKWYKEFPEVYICIGNHDELIRRKAMTHEIPKRFIKDYGEIWNSPSKWIWKYKFEIDDVLYKHGTGKTGKYSHIQWAADERQSVVTGHSHSSGGVGYLASKRDLIFGMNVGCGIDMKTYAMQYGRDFSRRPTLGCGVVLENGHLACFIPMNLGKKINLITYKKKDFAIRDCKTKIYQKNCQVCNEGFEAKRSHAQYCSPKCKKRAQRQKKKINEKKALE